MVEYLSGRLDVRTVRVVVKHELTSYQTSRGKSWNLDNEPTSTTSSCAFARGFFRERERCSEPGSPPSSSHFLDRFAIVATMVRRREVGKLSRRLRARQVVATRPAVGINTSKSTNSAWNQGCWRARCPFECGQPLETCCSFLQTSGLENALTFEVLRSASWVLRSSSCLASPHRNQRC